MRVVFLLLVSLFVFSSCEDDQNSGKNTNLLMGNWYLMKFQYSIQPDNEFNENDILWKIEEEDIVVSVNAALYLYEVKVPLARGGVFSYAIDVNSKKITFEDYTYDYEFISEDELYLKEVGYVDGRRITLKRVEE